MTADDWKKLPVGTPVRVKMPGANGTAGYLNTRTKRSAYYLGSGTLVQPVEGLGPQKVKDVEVIPQPEAAYG